MTHHTEAERAEFEAFASDNGKFPKAIERDAKGNYLLMHTAIGWMWWQAARRAPAAPVISEAQVLAITTAYEQGVGKGHQSHARKEAITNPYGDEWGCDSAWQMGYDEGREQAERKAAAHQPPDAFQTEGGLKSEIRTTSTAPVQMPEPAGCVVYANGESHHWDANRECAELFASSERSRGAPYAFTFENLYTEQQVRQLLADNGIGKDKA